MVATMALAMIGPMPGTVHQTLASLVIASHCLDLAGHIIDALVDAVPVGRAGRLSSQESHA
jgi:hypothetical protein